MTEINDPSTPEHVRYFIMSSIRIAMVAVNNSEGSEWRRKLDFFEFVDGIDGEIGMIAVDPITAQRFEIRIREEEE